MIITSGRGRLKLLTAVNSYCQVQDYSGFTCANARVGVYLVSDV